MVMDHYERIIPKLTPPEIVPLPYMEPVQTVPFHFQPPIDLDDLRKLLIEFKEAVEAAKKVDALTGKADCVDPEKQKLEARVRELELMLRIRDLEDENRRLRQINEEPF
jgi:hypothetical protein